MSTTDQQAQAKATAAYNAASDYYDHAANSFWQRFGKSTIERLQLQPGARVLDVCCGSGASAIPTAEAVGPNGSVLGIDLAENLLKLARAKAHQRGLTNIQFTQGDLLNLDLPAATFDAAVCVFGIFFVPDMTAAVRELWRLVRPRGKLAITTWGPNFFEPASTFFWNSVRTVRPDLYKGFNPWDRISTPEAVTELYAGAGINDVKVVAEAGIHKLNSAEAWWAAVLGSGYRGTIDQLSDDELNRVRQENLDFISRSHITSVEANVVYAVATR